MYVASVSVVPDVCCKCLSKYRKSISGVARDPPATATCCSCWVTSGRRGPVAGALPSWRRQAREKLSADVRAHTVDAQKTGGTGSISLANAALFDASALDQTFGC
jgi:hypothetical protein